MINTKSSDFENSPLFRRSDRGRYFLWSAGAHFRLLFSKRVAYVICRPNFIVVGRVDWVYGTKMINTKTSDFENSTLFRRSDRGRNFLWRARAHFRFLFSKRVAYVICSPNFIVVGRLD